MKRFKVYEKLDGSITITRSYGLEELGCTLVDEIIAMDEHEAVLRYIGKNHNREMVKTKRAYEL